MDISIRPEAECLPGPQLTINKSPINVVISVIIVNRNTAELIVNCIDSVYKTTKNESEIIVVDNASADNSEQLIRSRFPGVVWIQQGFNSGFSRANNRGVAAARGEIILFLNSDTIVQSNTIDAAMDRLLANPEIAVGVQLLNGDGSMQDSWTTQLSFSRLHGSLPLASYLLPSRLPDSPQNHSSGNLPIYIYGAFLMVKKKSFEEVGRFDEDFFLYAEEIELCSRLNRIGRLNVYPDLRCIHFGQASQPKGQVGWSAKFAQQQLSIQLLIRKRWGCLAYLSSLLITAASFFFYGLVTMIRYSIPFNKDKFRNLSEFASYFWKWLRFFPKMLLGKHILYQV